MTGQGQKAWVLSTLKEISLTIFMGVKFFLHSQPADIRHGIEYLKEIKFSASGRARYELSLRKWKSREQQGEGLMQEHAETPKDVTLDSSWGLRRQPLHSTADLSWYAPYTLGIPDPSWVYPPPSTTELFMASQIHLDLSLYNTVPFPCLFLPYSPGKHLLIL